MNRAAMRARLKTRYRDTVGALVVDSEWNAYLEDAQRDVHSATPWWPFFEQRATSPVIAAGETGAALPIGAVRVNGVFSVTDGVALAPLTGRTALLDEFPGYATTTGRPTHYRLLGTTLEILPRPNATTQLHVEYMIAPAIMDDDADEPAWPETYHHIVVEGALVRAYEDDDLPQKADRARGRFNELLERMKDDLLVTRTESYFPLPCD